MVREGDSIAEMRLESVVLLSAHSIVTPSVRFVVVCGHRSKYARKMEAASILRSVAGLFLALTTMTCGGQSSKTPFTVDEFITEIDQLNGQTVMVVGYLGECDALSCSLYRSKKESEEVDRAMSDIRAATAKGATDVSGFPFPDYPAVSIGNGSKFSFFDLRAYFYTKSYVVITGLANNQCRVEGRFFCFDRADELKPISIRSATPRHPD